MSSINRVATANMYDNSIHNIGGRQNSLVDLNEKLTSGKRVLRPGGRVCVLEITPAEGRLANAALKFYMRSVVPLASRLRGVKTNTPKIWRYYWDSIEACAPPAQILATLRSVGFADVARHTELGIFSAYTATKPV